MQDSSWRRWGAGPVDGYHHACCEAGSQVCHLGDYEHGLWSRLAYHDSPYHRDGAYPATCRHTDHATFDGPSGFLVVRRHLDGLGIGLCGDTNRGRDLGPAFHGTDDLQGCATWRGSLYRRHHGDPYRVGRHLSGGVFLAMVSGCL